MDIFFLIKGIVLGLSIAAPVGPIGVLCIRRTLINGRLSGIVSGLGAATADGFYGIVAAFGLSYISNTLLGQQFWLRLIGGSFLFYLGIRTFVSKTSERSVFDERGNLWSDYVSTLFLTLTNPMTILSFVAIFSGLGLGSTGGNYASAATIVIGVVSGSALWWIILSSGVNIFRSKFNFRFLRFVNWISGLIIISFATIILIGTIER